MRGFEDYFDFPFELDRPLGFLAQEDFRETISILELLKLDYWIADGTLLGFVREGSFIEHDTDIDFYLRTDNGIELLMRELLTHGYKIGRLLKYKEKIMTLIISNVDI